MLECQPPEPLTAFRHARPGSGRRAARGQAPAGIHGHRHRAAAVDPSLRGGDANSLNPLTKFVDGE